MNTNFDVKPWNEKSRRYLQQITKDGVFYTKDIDFTRSFGRRYPELFDEEKGFLDIGKIEKRNMSMIAKRPNTRIVPISGKKIRFKFYKIF